MRPIEAVLERAGHAREAGTGWLVSCRFRITARAAAPGPAHGFMLPMFLPPQWKRDRRARPKARRPRRREGSMVFPRRWRT